MMFGGFHGTLFCPPMMPKETLDLSDVWLVLFSILRKLDIYFLSNWMGYDRGDSVPLNFEPNGNPFGSENRKKNSHYDHIKFNLKVNKSLDFSVKRRRRQKARYSGLCIATTMLYLPFSDWFDLEPNRHRLVSNQAENGKYNLISGRFNKITEIFACVRQKARHGRACIAPHNSTRLHFRCASFARCDGSLCCLQGSCGFVFFVSRIWLKWAWVKKLVQTRWEILPLNDMQAIYIYKKQHLFTSICKTMILFWKSNLPKLFNLFSEGGC